MRIEDELKMVSIIDDYQKLYLNISFSSIWLEQKVFDSLKKFNITNPQYSVLRILHANHPKPLSAIALQERMFHKNSNVTRIIDKLYEKKLVTKQNNNDNRRMLDICLSENGFKLLEVISPIFTNLSGILPQESLTLEEAAQLNFLLNKLRS